MTNVGQTQLGANILRAEFQIKEKEKRSQKEKTRVGCWNVRSIYQTTQAGSSFKEDGQIQNSHHQDKFSEARWTKLSIITCLPVLSVIFEVAGWGKDVGG